ncbi:MAG: adenosylcobinamide-GDP ribazoletransferase [Lachnospiraceae bacterium]|nr:adenosylcobinamide-GDP ribazoletransferase [Lachnospiraceae bacterium]
MFNSFKLAFSMYSRIPMPRADWDKDKMKYVMAFFPLIGVAVGGGMILWNLLVQRTGINGLMSAAGRVLIPLLLTGGIHMDGFLDTIDARRSYQSFERKLEILKDPHTGAFAIIYGGIYLVAMLGLYSQVSSGYLWIVAIGFVLSRALSGMSVVAFKGAKDTGMAADFRLSAEKRRVFIALVVYAVLASAAMIIMSPLAGGLAVVGAFSVFGYYRVMSYREFGGVTGDLAGYFLQLCELAIAVAAAAATVIR